MLARATIYRDFRERNKKKTLFSFMQLLNLVPNPRENRADAVSAMAAAANIREHRSFTSPASRAGWQAF